MLCSNVLVREYIDSGAIGITPLVPENIQPSSVDLRLDCLFEVLIPGSGVLSPKEDPRRHFHRRELPPEGVPLVLEPGGCVLASTFEHVTVPPFLGATVDGKSSVGRLFTICHTTAGWVDPGFSGYITLELVNHASEPVELWPGQKICQLKFLQMDGDAVPAYGGEGLGSHYQHQERGPALSRSHLNFTCGLPPVRGEVAA